MSAPKVLICDAAYDDSMDLAIEKVLSEFPFPWHGKNVLLKPNILGPFSVKEGVTTHPSMVRSLVKKLKDRGAEVVLGDCPGFSGYGSTDNAARKCGLIDASDGCYVNLGRKPVKLELSSRYVDFITIAGDVLDADIVVNLPKLKTHGLTILSGALKNTFGYVLGGDKMRIHASATTPRRFAEALVDVYQARPPELNIMDAVVAMQGNGPSRGTLRTLGKVIASDNAVTLDAVIVSLIGRRNRDVPYVEIAGQRGLGEVDIEKIAVIGDSSRIEDFQLPTTFVPGLTGVFLNRLMSRMVNCVPEVIEDKCARCGVCVAHCPVNAMQMTENGPVADRDRCISCCCCHEMCREGAIKLTGRGFRLLRKMQGL